MKPVQTEGNRLLNVVIKYGMVICYGAVDKKVSPSTLRNFLKVFLFYFVKAELRV